MLCKNSRSGFSRSAWSSTAGAPRRSLARTSCTWFWTLCRISWPFRVLRIDKNLFISSRGWVGLKSLIFVKVAGSNNLKDHFRRWMFSSQVIIGKLAFSLFYLGHPCKPSWSWQSSSSLTCFHRSAQWKGWVHWKERYLTDWGGIMVKWSPIRVRILLNSTFWFFCKIKLCERNEKSGNGNLNANNWDLNYRSLVSGASNCSIIFYHFLSFVNKK